MGLYDERLADLSEPRKRLTARRPFVVGAARKPTSVQSLLFSRDAGWTASTAKAWAKSHGYKHSKVDVTDQYVRIRQFDPKGSKVKKTVTFGRGIKAVVAREGMKENNTMAKARRRHKKTPKRARRARRKHSTPRRHKRRKVRAAVAAPRRRRRRVAAAAVAAPRRRRRRVQAWRGDSAGHAKAAKKGHRRRKARRSRRRSHKRRRMHEAPVMAAPRRRRRRVSSVSAPRRRSYRRVSAHRGGGMGMAVTAIISGGVGFIVADGLDRFMATYNPSSTAEKPKDIFTSDGAGTLGNTLNVASRPGWKRAAVAGAAVAVPAAGAYFVKNRMAKTMFEGMLVGTGISGLRLLVNNVIMPMLVGKDTSTPALQKSFIARLYPAEVAAKVAIAQKPASAGVLSDPGPHALAGSPQYPDTQQALRAGLQDQYPSAADALRQRAGVADSSGYPSAADALRARAGVSEPYMPGPPPGPGPVTDRTDADCGCAAPAGLSAFLGQPDPSLQ